MKDRVWHRRGERALLQEAVNAQCRGSRLAEPVNALGISSEEFEQSLRRDGRLLRGLRHSIEEERQPLLPHTFRAHALQQRVVGTAILLQMQTEIKKRLRKDALVNKEQRYQQSANTTVAIEKRMNRLELHVGERRLYQGGRRTRFAVEELLKGTETFEQLVGRRRNVDRIARPAAADPVLGRAELPGLLATATTMAEQHAMDFADETQAERKTFAEALESVVHRRGITGDLLQIVERHPWSAFIFEKQKLVEGRLSPFDL